MTLPISPNSIAMSQVNVEIGRPATQLLSLNDADVRTLANKPGSGTLISMSDLRGKSWLSAQLVSAWVSANRTAVFKAQSHNNTSDYEAGNLNVQQTSYTANFNLTGATLPDSKWTTIVVFTVNGWYDDLRNANIKTLTFTTTDGSSPSAEPRVVLANDFVIGAAVLRVNTNFKKIASVTVTWSDGYTAPISTACIAVIPGKWNGQMEIGPSGDSDYYWYAGSYGYNIQIGATNIARAYAYPPVDVNLGNVTAPSGTTAVARNWWWYSSMQFHMLINPTADLKTFTVRGAMIGYEGGGEGDPTPFTMKGYPRGYRLHTFVEP